MSQNLDSEPELLKESSPDCKVGLPCHLKPFQKVIWGQAKKRETAIPASPWRCGEGMVMGSSLCLLPEEGGCGFPDGGGWGRRLGRAGVSWPWALSMMVCKSQTIPLPPHYVLVRRRVAADKESLCPQERK